MSGSRPEAQAPELFYNAEEAAKYGRSTRMLAVQKEMAQRALDLLGLPEGVPLRVLDIGAGSGLSGEVLAENGHSFVGVDISPSMLGVAVEREVDGDFLCLDVGDGLPFRPGSFSACISVSVIHFLCHSYTRNQVPQRRLKVFFQSLYNCLERGGKACLQFYPENAKQMEMISRAAVTAGFSAGVAIENEQSKKRKYYLVLTTGGAALPAVQEQAAAGAADVPEMSAAGAGAAARASAPADAAVFTVGTKKRERQGRKSKRSVKDKDWVLRKKDRRRAQGRQTARDSKFTARRRGPKF